MLSCHVHIHRHQHGGEGFSMGKISMAEAARVFAVSRPTLLKHLQQGKISGEKTTVEKNTFWQIEESELARVYPRRDEVAGNKAGNVTSDGMGSADNLQAEIRLLQAQLEAAEQLAEERARHLEDLRKLLGQERPARRSWWRWGG